MERRSILKKALPIAASAIVAGCQTISQYFPANLLPGEQTAQQPVVTTDFSNADQTVVLPDDFEQKPVQRLFDQPRNDDGSFILAAGFYEGVIQSFCLHAGTCRPGTGEGYLYAQLKGSGVKVLRHALAKTYENRELDQTDVQWIVWAILARTKFKDLQPHLQDVARSLLDAKELRAMDGDSAPQLPPEAIDLLMSKLPPAAARVVEAENALRDQLTRSDATYESVRKIAVLDGDPPPENVPAIPVGRWSKHPGGFFIRYFPQSFSQTRVQIYVEGNVEPTQEFSAIPPSLFPNVVRPVYLQDEAGAVDYDPTGDVAVPSNSGRQRLGFGENEAGAAEPPSPKQRWISPTIPQPHNNTNYKTPHRRQENNCRDLINNQPKRESWCRPRIDPTNVKRGSPQLRPDGTYEVSGTFDEKATSTIQLPSWTFPNMSDAQAAAVQSVLDNLQVHEQGHETIASQFATQHSGQSVAGVGSTASDAIKSFDTAMHNKINSDVNQLNKTENDYDTVTNHGLTQDQGQSHGYPGGDDTILNCP